MSKHGALIAVALMTVWAGSAAISPTEAAAPIFGQVTCHTVDLGGVKLFYREAGDASLPTLVLLHGNPSSSFMFRDLMPRLAPHFHVIAPDYPGYGYSDAPLPEAYRYTFDHLAEAVDQLLTRLGATSYILYMQDYGGPVGMRLATAHPERVKGIVVQNANAYLEGLPAQWRAEIEQQIKDTADHPAAPKPPRHEPPPPFDENLKENLKWTRDMYLTGAHDPAAMSPDGYTMDAAMLSRPDRDDIQDALGRDYYSNVLLYPTWQSWLRQRQPRTLLVWGRGDRIFGPAAAEAYKRDVPKAKLIFYDGGHFVLEEHAPEVAQEIIRMFARSDR